MLSNRVYELLKWVSLLCVPTVTLITSVSETLGFQHGAEVAAVVSALGVFAGAVIKISTDAYYKSEDNK
jgi:hypothetical protein